MGATLETLWSETTTRLILGDALEWSQRLETGSVDAIITDPPYGLYTTTVDYDPKLSGEMIRALGDAWLRVCRENAWLAVFSRMPALTVWDTELRAAGWEFREHIVWVKRSGSPTVRGMMRVHESILLYAKGRPQYHDVHAPWWDTQLPQVLCGGIDIKTVETVIEELHNYMATGEWHKLNSTQIHSLKRYLRSLDRTRMRLTNLWSFLSVNRSGGKRRRRAHLFEKPLPLMERLVRLLTAEGDTVFDPFMGTGTTLIAAARLGRHAVGTEREPAVFSLACAKLDAHNVRYVVQTD
jgi:site-specific DNA-methyltransferase (adenine-specific)